MISVGGETFLKTQQPLGGQTIRRLASPPDTRPEGGLLPDTLGNS